MQKSLSIIFIAVSSIISFGLDLQAQNASTFILATGNNARRVESTLQEPYFKNRRSQSQSSQIKDIQLFGDKSGIAYTSDTLFRTDDNGETWREIQLPKGLAEKIGAVYFENKTNGAAILGDNQNPRLELAQTQDGGNTWTKTFIQLRIEDALEADLENASLGILYNSELAVSIRIPTSSNFSGTVFYDSFNDRQNWEFKERLVYIRPDDKTPSVKVDNNWVLKTVGTCEDIKIGCVQESQIFNETKEITPPQIKELSRIEKAKAKLAASKSVFAQPPNGTTRVSLNRGFDKCTAATSAQMQTWWSNSPFYDVNIYLSGRNRGCSQPQLTAGWVNAVTTQGWGLIPAVVGYQSPCSVCASCQKHSSDPATAETQGRGEADIAVTDANNLGLTQGTVLYYDMERYDDTSGTGACSTPTKAFLKGWTDRLKELGYKSGIYGSPFNANGDWINMPAQSQPDIVWLARWNNIMSVWGVAPLADTFWTNHQRIHQWLGPRDETWGGVTFNIDNNIADAPVAGLAVTKNKAADFDGDGKTDISVWRSATGVWYVANSSNPSYTIINFGLSTDILAPGDFDGDGKTDLAVWRPDSGVWHLYSRSIYRSYQFGTAGDIPVPADYDGDGRTDIAVFRPSTGVWYVANSFDSRGTSFRIEQFGLSGDKPVPGDYDGDGRSDLAVFRPTDGNWYLLQSTAGFAAVHFGQNGDKPVQADYDGDGKTDLGIYRDGVWYLFQSQAGVYVTQFGLAADKPAVGDYDGDNKADITVFRPVTGVWYILQSGGGLNFAQFGISTDNPVPTAYNPPN